MSSQSVVVFESSSQPVAVVNSLDFVNDFEDGLMLTLTTLAAVGGCKVTIKVQRKDELSNSYIDIPGAVSIALGPNLSTDLFIKPGIGSSNNRRVNDAAPKVWRVVATIAGGTSIVFGVNGEYR